MWIFIFAAGLILFVGGIIYWIIAVNSNLPDDPSFLVFVGAVMMMISFGCGVRNYAQIPRIHQEIHLETVNKHHYYTAMDYNLGDESNERKSASHVRWFRNGDFSEAKDNKTWKQNYSDWFYNKSLITYHKFQLKYYSHPIRNWRDGAGMGSMYHSIHQPAN